MLVCLDTVANAIENRPTLSNTSNYGQFDMHSLSSINESSVPLFSVKLRAGTSTMKGNALDLVASYRSVGITPNGFGLQYNVVKSEFSMTTPRIKAWDFSQAIREKAEICPEKIFDKMVADGTVSFNMRW